MCCSISPHEQSSAVMSADKRFEPFPTGHPPPAVEHCSAVGRVVIQNITKVFQGAKGEKICALSGVDLSVADRECLVLAGPSGSGKSTLLRLLAGLEEPTAGTILMDGKNMERVPPEKRDIAMVFQNPALYPHLTVFENMG